LYEGQSNAVFEHGTPKQKAIDIPRFRMMHKMQSESGGGVANASLLLA